MAVQIRDPNTIHLGGEITMVADLAAGEAIIPGALVDRAAGAYVNHAAAGGLAQPAFALEQAMMNAGQDQDPHVLTIDHPYAADDLMMVGVGKPGSTFYALLASGENVTDGAELDSNGDGKLKAGTTAPPVRAIEDVNNTSGANTRIRVEVI